MTDILPPEMAKIFALRTVQDFTQNGPGVDIVSIFYERHFVQESFSSS